MQPTTPTGSRTISELPTCCSSSTSSSRFTIEPTSMIGRPAWIMRERPIGMPTSRAMSAAISSERCCSPAVIARSASIRCSIVDCDHASKPARAALTAWSTSASVPSATVPTTSSVVASITSTVSRPVAETHSPPM
jgi:hypothetical protein